MTLEFQYGRGVCCLPQRVAQYLAQAPGEACRIVLYLASNPRMCRGIERKYKEIAAACGVTPQDVRSAVLYWMERGVLQQCTSSEEQTEESLLGTAHRFLVSTASVKSLPHLSSFIRAAVT